MRARRVASAVSLAVAGALVLGACGRAQPDVAAYVGDARYSTSRVDAIYTDAQTKFHDAVQAEAAQAGASASPDQLKSPVTRQDVVNLLVSIDLGKRVAAEKQIAIPDKVTADQLVQQIRMPPEAEYAKLWGEWIDIYQTLGAKLPPAELSDNAVMAVYQALVKAGAIKPGLSVAEVRQAFGPGQFVQSTTALSVALSDEAKRVDVEVNPLYRPLALPAAVSTQNGAILYALPYVDQAGPVTDLAPTAEPSASAQ